MGSMFGMRVVLISIVLLLTFYSSVSAMASDKAMGVRKNPTATSAAEKREAIQQKIEAKKAEIQQKIAERKEQIATKAAERRERLAERRRELIRKYFMRMHGRFLALVNRLERIAEKISSRLDKMEAREIDVSSLRSDLTLAVEEIEVAKGLLTGLDQQVEQALASDDAKGAFEEVRDIVKETRDILKEVHKKLVAIIVAMKGPQTEVKEATAAATPTATQSANTQ